MCVSGCSLTPEEVACQDLLALDVLLLPLRGDELIVSIQAHFTGLKRIIPRVPSIRSCNKRQNAKQRARRTNNDKTCTSQSNHTGGRKNFLFAASDLWESFLDPQSLRTTNLRRYVLTSTWVKCVKSLSLSLRVQSRGEFIVRISAAMNQELCSPSQSRTMKTVLTSYFNVRRQ